MRSVSLALVAVVLSMCELGVASACEVVAFASGMARGTIIVRTSERRLYLVLGSGEAMRYPVGVGRPGRQWAGTAYVDGKHLLPNWQPPDAVRADKPNLPDVIAGGSPSNPMGAAALTLSGGYDAIHGTNRPDLIGGFVSYGCIRMFNSDIADPSTVGSASVCAAGGRHYCAAHSRPRCRIVFISGTSNSFDTCPSAE